MNNLFTGLDHNAAMEVEALARLHYELRENFKLILQSHGVADDAELLDAIRTARIEEHPAYEHYVAARVLADGIAFARAQMTGRLPNGDAPVNAEATLHMTLKTLVEARHAEHLAAPPVLTQDALTVRLNNDVALTIRYAAPDTYSFRWQAQGSELGIDTAPVHTGLSTTPNHFHDVRGNVLADPVTDTKGSPESNLSALIDALLRDPLLGSGSD